MKTVLVMVRSLQFCQDEQNKHLRNRLSFGWETIVRYATESHKSYLACGRLVAIESRSEATQQLYPLYATSLDWFMAVAKMNAVTLLGTEGYICLYARVSRIDFTCGEALFVSNEHNRDYQFSPAPCRRLSRRGSKF